MACQRDVDGAVARPRILAALRQRAGLAAGMSAAGHRPQLVGSDPQVGDFVAQRVAMDAERLRGAADVAGMLAQRGDDELLLELAARLLECDALTNQLIDDLKQTPIEILFRHVPLLDATSLETK